MSSPISFPSRSANVKAWKAFFSVASTAKRIIADDFRDVKGGRKRQPIAEIRVHQWRQLVSRTG